MIISIRIIPMVMIMILFLLLLLFKFRNLFFIVRVVIRKQLRPLIQFSAKIQNDVFSAHDCADCAEHDRDALRDQIVQGVVALEQAANAIRAFEGLVGRLALAKGGVEPEENARDHDAGLRLDPRRGELLGEHGFVLEPLLFFERNDAG